MRDTFMKSEECLNRESFRNTVTVLTALSILLGQGGIAESDRNVLSFK